MTEESMNTVRIRADIEREIAEKLELVSQTKKDILQLRRESVLLCDEKQWFTEVEEEVIISRRPKKTEKQLIGRVHWIQEYRDEDTDNCISIQRCEVIRINGEWI